MNLSNIYIGTVLNNSDISDSGIERPNGQVKVLIKGISNTGPAGDAYKFPLGGNIDSKVSDDTSKLVDEQEFWALVMQPVMGGGGSLASYNATTDQAVISDNDFPSNNEAPAHAENYTQVMGDGFAASGVGSAGMNPNANSYTPDNRSNCPKGSFGMPDVGDEVIIAFIGGARSRPIVLGVVNGVDALDAAYGAGGPENVWNNYPLAYSNIT